MRVPARLRTVAQGLHDPPQEGCTMINRHISRRTRALAVLGAIAATAAVAPSAQAKLAAVGPVSATTSFPSWYQDASTKFALCDDARYCTNVPGAGQDEMFWWSADAQANVVQARERSDFKGLLVYAVEAAYANGDPEAGQEVAFGRIRIKIDRGTPGRT